MDYSKILNTILPQLSSLYGQGKVADYIPELAKVEPRQFAMSVFDIKRGQCFDVGSAGQSFSIQSISKAFGLILAMEQVGDDIWQRVNREPSGAAFNSLVQLEYEKGYPRNPFINAGAIVVADVLLSVYDDPIEAMLGAVRYWSRRDDIAIDEAVAKSEEKTGHRNFALAHFLKSFGQLNNCVEDVLSVYFKQCAITMTTQQLAQAFVPLANRGKLNTSEQQVLPAFQIKRINSIMQSCGFYDQAGEFTYRVGLPGKSGVGGGIAAVMPDHYAVAVWSPELNSFGNSVLGMRALELFTTETGLSIF